MRKCILVVIASVALFPLATAHAAQPQRGLTGAPQLARAYDVILDARFDDLPAVLKRTCPPAPSEVCQLLDVVGRWWRIQLNPTDTSRDADFEARAEAAITAIDAWTRREPERAEAWFYLGGAYGVRGQHRVLRKELLSAARDGKRIKDALERSLELDPGLSDAYFGIGLYHYYADIAPAAAKLLRFLLLLPGGDRAEGLREMLRARDGGQLLRSEADYQLHVIYLWYEKEPLQALELIEGLKARHPSNPHFPQVIAEIQDVYLHDATASLRTWEGLLRSADSRQVAEPELAEAQAHLGIATQLDRLYETDRAVEHLRLVIADAPLAPAGAVEKAQLQLRRATQRLNDPAYRLSIEGWRAFERGALPEAARALAHSISLRQGDPVTRYRQARLLIAQRHESAALPILEGLIGERNTVPPTFYADACVAAARIHEQQNAHARAIELYATAATVFGADQRTKQLAQREAARLTRR